MRRAPDAEELKRLDLVERTRLRAKVKAEAQRRGLASVMNQTRWEELRATMLSLPFKPVFQLQAIPGPREPLWSSDQVTSRAAGVPNVSSPSGPSSGSASCRVCGRTGGHWCRPCWSEIARTPFGQS